MATDQTETRAAGRPAPPLPLVKLTHHPIGWLRNKITLLVAALILAYIGTLIVAAMYYLLFESNADMNSAWHWAISNSALRHNIRNVGEGFLGGLLAQQVVWNHYKRRRNKLSRLDKLEIRLHIPNVKDGQLVSFWQLLATPFLALTYAIPGFLAALGIAWLIQHHVVHLPLASATQSIGRFLNYVPTGHSMWSKFQATWAENWDKKLMGLGASFFFGRRPAKGVFDDLQLWFAEQRVHADKPPRWHHTPTFRARYNDVLAHPETIQSTRHGKWQQFLAVAVLVVGIGLATWGWYILAFVAGA